MSNLEQKLGYQFQNASLLEQALTHKSAHFEMRERGVGHNEKLEFLGDAVLDLILSELLMELFPADGEGNLSKKRASLVNEGILARIFRNLDLMTEIRLGKGEVQTGGDQKPRILASTYEALLGAIFLDSGFESAKRTARKHFAPVIQELDPLQDFSADFKTRLQEEVQGRLREAPQYSLLTEQGPPHDRTFEVEVMIQNESFGRGQGKTKKMAEQEAARVALEKWKSRGEEQ